MLPARLQFIIAVIACAINERMQRKLDYAQEEIRVLKEALTPARGSSQISFSADQRRRLAVAGRELTPVERRKYCTDAPIICRSRLGGFLNYYHREAA